jgi:transcriptional regulator with XRE-family HTH domain
LGAGIRARRAVLGLSEVGLAKRLGVRLAEVRSWERGGRLPEITVVRAIARVLEVDSATMLQWLEMAGLDVGTITGEGEIPIVLLTDDAPADPFAEPSVTVDLASPPAVDRPVVQWAPTPSTPVESIRLPPGPSPILGRTRLAPAAVVFPEPDGRTVVYSAAAPETPQVVRRMSRRRRVVTAIALIALGITLWWAFGQLGRGLSSVVDEIGGLGLMLGV